MSISVPRGDSQGGGVLQVGNTYYWHGVKYGGAVTYAAKPDGKNSDISFQGVTIYSFAFGFGFCKT